MIGLTTTLAGYRAAAAELSGRVRLIAESGDIVAVSGDPSGLDIARRVTERGVRAVIIDRPRLASDDLGALRATGVAVILNRPALRADDAGDASPSTTASAVSVQAHVARGALRGMLTDAVGWGRVLAAGPLALRAAGSEGGRDGGERAVLADLTAPGRTGVALIASERLGTRGEARLRATVVAPERVDVVWSDGVALVTRSTRAGTLAVPRRWESPERLALRRALAALEGEAAIDDVDDWNHDAGIARAILAAR